MRKCGQRQDKKNSLKNSRPKQQIKNRKKIERRAKRIVYTCLIEFTM